MNSSELAYAGAVTFSNLSPNLGSGSIRVGHYSVDPLNQGTPQAKAATHGTVIGIEQDIGVFARCTQANGRQALSKETEAIGAVWTSEDWLGFGLGYVKPTKPGTKNEMLTEIYYRMQVGPVTQFTVGAILLDRPNNTGGTGTEAVFNVRLRAHF